MSQQFRYSASCLTFIHSLGEKFLVFILGEMNPQPLHNTDLNPNCFGSFHYGSAESKSAGCAGSKTVTLDRFKQEPIWAKVPEEVEENEFPIRLPGNGIHNRVHFEYIGGDQDHAQLFGAGARYNGAQN